MRLLSFTVLESNKREWGVQGGDGVYSGMSIASSLDDLIHAGPTALDELLVIARPDRSPDYALSDIRVEVPLRHPSKVVAIGQNYMDHCRECNAPIPTRPIVFAKFPSSLIGPTDDIQWCSELTQQVDWEAELGVVIGKAARHVPEETALDYVFGYTVINDVSARDLQGGDGQWVRGKSLDTFCPMGPGIVTADEIPDPQDLDVRCWVNGMVMQDSNTLEMIFNVRYLISFLSRAFTLNPGDVISTGTPHGVGVGRDPQIFLQDGDVVEVEVERIGRLRNVCRIQS
jgi:2-keto-4-pentenoate hydratase/2-oxohepta-3-ene-1,7-dioic acid hydratase in catechol pathway